MRICQLIGLVLAWGYCHLLLIDSHSNPNTMRVYPSRFGYPFRVVECYGGYSKDPLGFAVTPVDGKVAKLHTMVELPNTKWVKVPLETGKVLFVHEVPVDDAAFLFTAKGVYNYIGGEDDVFEHNFQLTSPLVVADEEVGEYIIDRRYIELKRSRPEKFIGFLKYDTLRSRWVSVYYPSHLPPPGGRLEAVCYMDHLAVLYLSNGGQEFKKIYFNLLAGTFTNPP